MIRRSKWLDTERFIEINSYTRWYYTNSNDIRQRMTFSLVITAEELKQMAKISHQLLTNLLKAHYKVSTRWSTKDSEREYKFKLSQPFSHICKPQACICRIGLLYSAKGNEMNKHVLKWTHQVSTYWSSIKISRVPSCDNLNKE